MKLYLFAVIILLSGLAIFDAAEKNNFTCILSAFLVCFVIILCTVGILEEIKKLKKQ